MGDEGVQMEKRLGLLNGCGIIIGNIVGSGIFISPTGVLKSSGSIGMSLAMWIACGLYSILGALCYAELGTTIKASGGEYAYIHEAFGPLLAFVQLWATMLIIRPAAQAIVAATFAKYIIQPFLDEDCESPQFAINCIGCACVLLITFINCVSIRASTLINDVFMVAKVLSLVLIIVTGGYYMIFEDAAENYRGAFDDTITDPFELSMAFYSGMFAYAGWNYLNFMTDEIINPNRNLPLAIVISLPLVTVIYVLANVAYFAAMRPDELLSSPAVGITFADKFLGSASWIMPILVAMSTFSAVNGSILTGSRLTLVGAKYRQLPQLLAMVNLKFLTPIPSVILTGVISCLMILPGNIGAVLNYFSFVFYFTIDLSVAVLIYLRIKRPELERPIRFYIIFPVAFVVICTIVLLFSIYADPFSTGIGILMAMSAVPVYFIFIVFQDKLHVVKIPQMTDAVTFFLQKWLMMCLESSGGAATKTDKAVELEDRGQGSSVEVADNVGQKGDTDA